MRLNIDVENVTVTYKDFEAIKGVSFHLESGKIYGFIGRNGAGKTTMLSLLASFREPSSGSIKIGGENPFENGKITPYVSFIYNADYTDETEKVKGLLEVAERYRPNFDAIFAEKLVKRFKLPLDKPVYKLSKGMQSALNVTIGLASRSPITIFDEAYIGMDAPTREIFYQELLEDHEKHPRTIILSTHLVSEMDYLFDEVLIIHKGELVAKDSYEDFIGKGTSITGSSEVVETFVRGMELLNTQQLGNTKRVVVYGQLSDEKLFEAGQLDLEIGTIPLQDLFIHLTREEE
ncbi:ABC transporter [Bacillus manliponensis]|uniref:ABC transporter n=1 Tax=Bacillus manliponensis TaxID=574376 RepID=A0A073K8S7_9BACI|nr:ABC transporter ATP-binding protein [Bacillus manliponensis]KEK18688.1 ABC transporter [Bacillus manliponensis]